MTAPHTLLELTGRMQASDSKSVAIHTFDLPPGVAGLAFEFDFSPRASTDVAHNTALVEAALEQHKLTRQEALRDAHLVEARREVQGMYRTIHNLLNAVLIDPQGQWRGRWDRNPASEGEALFLSETAASPGFLPGPLTPGRWTVAVECHGVFGPAVEYRVKLSTRLRGDAGMAQALKQDRPRTKRASKGPGWFFGEMHSHTVHSDGMHELHELAARGASLGIDFISLTDHNTTSALADTADLPVTIVKGCELTTFHGHHPIYGVEDLIPWHIDGRVQSLAEMAPLVRRHGGLVSVAHPFRMGDPICTGCRMPQGLKPTDFDLFEVWYRKWDAPEIDNAAAYALWNRFWREGHRITAVAARDWHGPSHQGPFPGPMPFTGVWATDDSPAGLLAGMKSGRVIMSGGPLLDLELVSGGKRANIGSELHGSKADAVVRIERLDAPCELKLYGSGDLAHTLRVEKDGTYELNGLAKDTGWYRAELWASELPRAITNHVVLSPSR